MPFALDSNPKVSEISEAINYLLGNFGANLSADPNTGEIKGPTGNVIAYLYQYLSVKYADSADGALNFSNSPTDRQFFGVNNSSDTTESTNPADYIWKRVAGGFGTTKFLFYQTIGGRSITFVVDTVAPSGYYIQDSGTAINLDIVTASTPGLSSNTAYRVQSQTDPTPGGFPQTTAGASVPAGWTTTLGTVSVGQVAWYIFGRYNSTGATVDGIPPNSTYWTSPIAASVFQDIRSDNWNGSNPPTSSPATWGTDGYYLKKSDGSIYLSNVYGRGYTVFDGNTSFGGFDAAMQANTSFQARDGIVAFSSSSVSGRGMVGVSSTSTGTGVLGVGGFAGGGGFGIGVRGETNSATNAGGSFINTGGGPNVNLLDGVLRYQGVNIQPPPSSSSYYLAGDGNWYIGGTGTVTSVGLSVPSVFAASGSPVTSSGTLSFNGSNNVGWLFNNSGSLSWTQGVFSAAVTNSGNAFAAGGIMNLLGSTSTGIAGAYVGTSASGGSTVTWTIQTTSPSDERLKKDVAPIDVGLEFVKQLNPVSYKLKSDPKNQTGYGFIAQEVSKLGVDGSSLVYFEPEWEVEGKKGFHTIHYPSYIAVLTKAIQELSAKVEELERKLNAS
jgi:hypothetical protein